VPSVLLNALNRACKILSHLVVICGRFSGGFQLSSSNSACSQTRSDGNRPYPTKVVCPLPKVLGALSLAFADRSVDSSLYHAQSFPARFASCMGEKKGQDESDVGFNLKDLVIARVFWQNDLAIAVVQL
jgi:hypothetical protein